MDIRRDITGLVLAGGRGSRMGSVNKGLQDFHGKPLVARVLDSLRRQLEHIAISANDGIDAYRAFGLPVLADPVDGYAGPVAGLLAGLQHCGTPWLLTVPCDTPFLPDDLAARLAHAAEAESADVAIAVTGGQKHPVFCLVRAALAGHVAGYLHSGGSRMDGWHAGLTVTLVEFAAAECFVNFNTMAELGDALHVRNAQRLIRAAILPIESQETLPLDKCLGRVLAHDLVSPIDVPAHDNSAMDGYGLRGADLAPAGPITLALRGTVLAGAAGIAPLAAGECVRIMTGARLPPGCDTVIAQEAVEAITESRITIAPASVKPGDNRRLRGEDLGAGKAALHGGTLLRPAHLGLVASLGVATLAVRRRLRVALFSTGDELRALGEALPEGCVYDSNRSTVRAMLERLGCEVLDMGIVRDNPQALEAALRDASVQADAIITSGGVSGGDADYTRDVVARLGEVGFWKLAMRPGRPLAFGRIGKAWLFGLPGNPVAAMVSFHFFTREALLQMMGTAVPLPPMRARAAHAMRKRPGRTEFQRGVLSADGREVRLTGAQGSGILRSMAEANCIVMLDHDQGNVAAGDEVQLIPFEGLA